MLPFSPFLHCTCFFFPRSCANGCRGGFVRHLALADLRSPSSASVPHSATLLTPCFQISSLPTARIITALLGGRNLSAAASPGASLRSVHCVLKKKQQNSGSGKKRQLATKQGRSPKLSGFLHYFVSLSNTVNTSQTSVTSAH